MTKIDDILIGLARDAWKTGFNDKALSISDNFGTTIEIPKSALYDLILKEVVGEDEPEPTAEIMKEFKAMFGTDSKEVVEMVSIQQANAVRDYFRTKLKELFGNE